MIDLWCYEREFLNKGYSVIAGIDEAGRGPLCGPVCAAAVILPFDFELNGINDSKKLSEKKRDELYEYITEKALDWAVAFASPKEIDDLNILKATFLAMRRAVAKLKTEPELLLIDGNRFEGFGIPFRTVIKGDSLSASIAAASIIAKVTRDRYMSCLDKRYPQYDLKSHKGYPTKEHYKKLDEFGIEKFYRKTFLKNYLEPEENKNRKYGKKGEEYAKVALESQGYNIIAENFRKKCGEIDLIAEKGNIIAFVEVKTRSSNLYGRPCEAVTKEKRLRIYKTALEFLKQMKLKGCPRFDIFEVYLNAAGNIKYSNHIESAFELENITVESREAYV